MFSLLTATNAILWISFAPIQGQAAQYYNTSNTGINILSTSFLALYLPGSLLAATLMSKHGLRYCMVWGALMNSIAGWIRYVSAMPALQDGPEWLPYTVLLTGQCVAAIAQPLFTNAPTVVSVEWFATEERDIATTIAALFNLIGNAAGQVLPPLLVTVPDGTGMDTLLLIQAILASFGGILTFTFFRDRPANIFPSRIAKMKAREKARVRHESQRLAALSEEVDGMGAAVLELGGAADLGVSEVWVIQNLSIG